MSRIFGNLEAAVDWSLDSLEEHGTVVDAEHWQGIPTEGRPDMMTKEIVNLSFSAPIPETTEVLGYEVKPNLPWAEIEFQERVGGEAHNPHQSLPQWPWWRGQTDETMEEGEFTHTYSERFWPNTSGEDPVGKIKGIRYRYGDLDDVVNLLRRYPHTRQATFPIFFPEDTGAVHDGRIPCSLHYHFLLRQDYLSLWYPIRSCDAIRHFRDDLYMAGRLCQWILDELGWQDVKPGMLHFTAYSFHVHRGDAHLLRQ